jgi:hypothetical protein
LKPIVGSFEPGKWQFPTLLKTRSETGNTTPGETDIFFQCLAGLPAGQDTAWFGSTPHRAFQLLGTQTGGTVYPSFTAWFQQSHTAFYISGATVDQAEFNIVGNDLVKINWSGGFARHGWCGTDVVVSASSTAITVQDAKKYFLAIPGDTLYVDIVDPNTFAVIAGAVQVTAVNYTTNTLTVVGGGGAAGDLVVPHINLAAEDTTLQPLYGKFGLVQISPFVDYTSANLPATPQVLNSAKITVTNGIKYYADIKDDTLYPSQYAAPSFREVKGEIGIYYYRNIPDFNWKNLSDPIVTDYIIVPAEDRLHTAGNIFQIHLPQCIYETPQVTGEDEKTATIGFRSVASNAYNNEIAFVFYGG